MTDSPISETIDSEIITLTFCRPAERNPLSNNTLAALENALDRIEQNSKLRALVLTGTDDVFLSGANIRELQTLNAKTAREFSERGQRLTQAIADLNLTTIAAINGYCMGGGLDFALACDIRIASSSAVFAHPGARLGIITGWGGTQRLPRLIGRSNAIELFATAKRLTSAEALRVGLISEVADPVYQRAIELAGTTF